MDTRNSVDRGLIWGFLLVSIGSLFLLQTMGILDFAWEMTIGIAFLLGAAAFGALFVRDRHQWWAVFPAFALGFLGVTILLDDLTPDFRLGGSLFLGGLGLAFAAIYAATGRSQFWPIIPGGVLLTLAVVSGLDAILPRMETGWIFFGGLSATFGFVWWEGRQQHQWALVVALVCGVLSAIILIGSLMRFLFPLALIAAGFFLLVRKQRHSNGSE